MEALGGCYCAILLITPVARANPTNIVFLKFVTIVKGRQAALCNKENMSVLQMNVSW